MMTGFEQLLSIKLSHLAAGLAGGIVRSLLVGSNWYTALTSVVIGALTAAYITSPVASVYARVWDIPLSAATEHAVAYVIGMTAMLICEGIAQYVGDRSKKLTDHGKEKP